jgi:hypothetical protein
MFSGTTSAVVWSEPNLSQIEAWSSTIYAWYQEFEFEFFLNFFLNFKQKQVAKIKNKIVGVQSRNKCSLWNVKRKE